MSEAAGAGTGTDSVTSSVDHTLGLNVENLTLTGTAANGTGNDLANTLAGTAQANTLDGDAGADETIGLRGNDSYVVDDANDAVAEVAGGGTADTVRSSIDYTLGAEVENLTLTGTAISPDISPGFALMDVPAREAVARAWLRGWRRPGRGVSSRIALWRLCRRVSAT